MGAFALSARGASAASVASAPGAALRVSAHAAGQTTLEAGSANLTNRETIRLHQVNTARTESTDIRSFVVDFPDAALEDLRRRINVTNWPERALVTDASQGVQLATTQALARYWASDYDWRTVEARLNSYPNYLTEIDGLDIHFMHARSRHEDALPDIVTHGWPDSIIEQLKIIKPLTNPTAYGGTAADAFHVVIPSLPGHGFSAKPTATGWDPQRIAQAHAVLMQRLGYARSVAQGGDWGNAGSGGVRR